MITYVMNQGKIKDGDIIPSGLRILKLTGVCKFNTQFKIDNITKYLESSPDSCLSLVDYKYKKKTIAFNNQVTIQIKANTGKYIRMKIFNNGSVLLTRCKSIENIVECIAILCYEFKKEKNVLDDDITFVTNPNNLNLRDILDVKIPLVILG
jgi:TATA-box binding protein (TBP) (component of TFIID and TFIIIB)